MALFLLRGFSVSKRGTFTSVRVIYFMKEKRRRRRRRKRKKEGINFRKPSTRFFFVGCRSLHTKREKRKEGKTRARLPGIRNNSLVDRTCELENNLYDVIVKSSLETRHRKKKTQIASRRTGIFVCVVYFSLMKNCIVQYVLEGYEDDFSSIRFYGR